MCVGVVPHVQSKLSLALHARRGKKLLQDIQIQVIEFRCVVTVNTPAVWLASENIKRLTPRPRINDEYSHGVVYIEERPVEPFHRSDQLSSIPIIYIPNLFST